MKLLDTTVIIDIDRGGSQVINKARKLDSEGTHAISAVTEYEFYWGIFRRYEKGSVKYKEAIAKAKMLFSRFYVLPVTSEIAIKAAEIGTYLISEGKAVGIRKIKHWRCKIHAVVLFHVLHNDSCLCERKINRLVD